MQPQRSERPAFKGGLWPPSSHKASEWPLIGELLYPSGDRQGMTTHTTDVKADSHNRRQPSVQVGGASPRQSQTQEENRLRQRARRSSDTHPPPNAPVRDKTSDCHRQVAERW